MSTIRRFARVVKRGRSKYNARKVQLDGHTFDSRKEADRYGVLKVLQQQGTITGLECQVPYRLVVNGQLVCRYLADFRYVREGRVVTEDAKGYRTPVYRLKVKLLRALLGIVVEEV